MQLETEFLSKKNFFGRFIGLIAVLLAIAVLGSLGYVGFATGQLGAARPILVTSGRSISEDTPYILSSQKGSKVKYMRAEEAFVWELETKNGLRFVQALRYYSQEPDGVSYKPLTEAAGAKIYSDMERFERDSKAMPTPLLGILAGLGIGLLFRLRCNFLPLLMSLLTFTTIFKLANDCPTCTEVRIFGINAASVGVLLFGILSLFCILKPTKAVWGLVAIFLSCTLGWQIWAWWETKDFCAACITISAIAGFTLINLKNWIERSDTEAQEASNFYKLSTSAFIFVVCGLAMVRFGPIASLPEADSSIIGFSRENPILNLSQIGISPDPQFSITVIASTDCRPCHNLLDYLKELELHNIRYVSVVKNLPDNKHEWVVLKNPRSVASTPLVLITDRTGKVLKMFDGFIR